EFMLAGFWDLSEPSLAECIRSFPVVPFVGTEWLTQLDTATQQRKKIRRQDHGGAHFKHSELYGWRGTDPRVYRPRTLLEVHRQTLTLEEAKARFEQEAKQRKRHPEVQLTCRLCSFLQPGQEKLKPLHAFLDDQEASRFSVVAQGMDRV
ncbi:unnamed protein product, partial [Effrenium voratum]